MNISIKVGVDLRGLQPQMVLALLAIEEVFETCGAACVITSGSDGTHMTDSLHYKGLALDLRSKRLTASQKVFALNEMKVRLGAQFDVILEGENTESEHFHVEFDPHG